ncbi:MAG: Spy/CpxP family protein refolding chaperone [Burkholderiales bacterium]|nr:Spy/CpxP family protein refolding chaperone [Burkholderiales bacterium]
MKSSTKLLALSGAVAAALALGVAAIAQAPQPGPGPGPGMMGQGMGPGMMQGYGPGGGRGYSPDCGMGPGMMGGYGPGSGGMGPGMMGGMMGPGVTGYGMMGGYGPGYGMGPGMMGGMMGPGMTGSGMMGPLWSLDLSDAQRAQISKIHDEVRRKNWDVLGKMQDEQAKLRDAYATGKRDRAAILGAYKRIGELRLQRIENALDAREKLEGVLTQEQREQLRRWGPWWMMGGEQ